MAANLAWLQKWSTQLGWTDAWSDGWPLSQSTDLAAVGHMTLAQSGLGYTIEFQLGDLSLAMVGHSTLSGNVTMMLPEQVTLGNLSLAMVGHAGLSTPIFDTVDPYYIDPPNMLPMTGRMGFPGTITIATVVAHPLGNVTLPMVGHAALSSPTLGLFVSKDLGALTLGMIGGLSMTADIVNRTGAAHPLGDVTLPIYGRATLVPSQLISQLPPHPLGDVTLPMVGRATTAVVTLFSGGPISVGALTLAMVGRTTVRFDLSYPPFDAATGISAVLDESVGPAVARVEPMGIDSE